MVRPMVAHVLAQDACCCRLTARPSNVSFNTWPALSMLREFNQAQLGYHVRFRLISFFKAAIMVKDAIICSESCPQVSPQWWGGCPALQQQRQGVLLCLAAGASCTWLILGNDKIAMLTDLLKLLPLLIIQVVQVLIKLHTRHPS